MIEKMKEQLANIEIDYAKFVTGNKSAGTRTRKGLQGLKKLCQQFRLEIMGKAKEAPASVPVPKIEEKTQDNPLAGTEL